MVTSPGLYASTFFQGKGTSDVSSSHGSWPSKALWKRSMSRVSLASGDTTQRMLSCPSPARKMPLYGLRRAVVRSPYDPQCAAGQRTDPPMSVPMPMTDDRVPTQAPSPPEEPPGLRRRLYGLTVVP